MKRYIPLALCCALFPRLLAAAPLGMDPNGGLQACVSQPAADFGYCRLENGLQLRVNGISKNVLFYGPRIVRVNANLGKSHWVHPSLAVIARPRSIDFSVLETDKELRASTTELSVIVNKQSGALSFLGRDGRLLTREDAEAPQSLREVLVAGEPTYEVSQRFLLDPQESLYGLGQYNRPYMDYRGQEVLLVQTNIGIVVPFMVSTRRYGLLWDICSRSTFKDDASGAVLQAESAPGGVDYYLVAGETMDGVIAGYRQLTGAAPMLPKAAFGLFMSKERYKTQERLLEVARAFRKDGFPLDYIVQDWQYWGSDSDGTWSGMIWNPERYPDPKALTKTLHEELHLKVMNSIWPSVGNDTELAKELDAKGLRFEPLHWISKRARIYDAFSAEGRAIYFKHVKKGLLDQGVDALWMDGTEVEVGGACHDAAQVEADIKSLGKNAMGDFVRYLNPYTLLTTQGTYEGQRATSDKRVFTLTRSAWAGAQRYSAVSWSGDTTASWETFRAQISGGLNVAMAGQPYWTQDTGGFFVNYAGGEKNAAYRELYARWNQFAIFNPIYRIHGTNIEREPYLFRSLDPEIYQSLLGAARLRYRLLPYIYGLAWRSTRDAYTMMRALPMDFPDELELRKVDDQFMFGDAFLVQPVTRAMYQVENPPPPTIPGEYLRTPEGRPGVSVQYYEGVDLNKVAGAAVDALLEYRWPGPPLANPPPGLTGFENFSGRWQGALIAPEAGEYEIGVEYDDGARLSLGGKQVVDDWSFGPKRYKGTRITLSKGQLVPFLLEYHQGKYDRALRLAWRRPSELLALASKKQELDNLVRTRLPAGSEWYDFWTNERKAGGSDAAKACDLGVFPLYVRAGSIVPMGPDVQHVMDQAGAPLEVRIYAGADARFTIHEDDGETYAYERGEYADYDLVWTEKERSLSVSARRGAYPGMTTERALKVVLVGDGAPKEQRLHYRGEPLRAVFP